MDIITEQAFLFNVLFVHCALHFHKILAIRYTKDLYIICLDIQIFHESFDQFIVFLAGMASGVLQL